MTKHRRHKKILRLARGYFGAKSKKFRIANQAVMKSLMYAYRDRKAKKRTFRQLWIARINAAARLHGTTYSRLIDGLNKKQIDINRKVLAELAVTNPEAFAEIVKFATA